MENSELHKVLAYGSNLDSDDWNKFVKDYAKSAVHFKPKYRVFIPDYVLTFDKYAVTRGGGVANIDRRKGCVVEAMLFEANAEGLRLLRKKEGYPNPQHYDEKEVIAIREDGSEVTAKAYIYKEGCPDKEFVQPSETYLNICRKGYKKHGLWLDPLETAAMGNSSYHLDSLFVYGSLMRGESRYPTLSSKKIHSVVSGHIFGGLTTNGKFPGLDLRLEGNFTKGEFFTFDNFSEVIAETDKIEGFYSFGDERNLFRRTCVLVDVGDIGQKLAWVYVYDGPLGASVFKNDWRLYTGNKFQALKAIVNDFIMYDGHLGRKLANEFPHHKNRKCYSANEIVEMLDNEVIEERKLYKLTGFCKAAIAL
jgi:gamma-glutamylcyclotransferase (GGCT)/AIG2-like uncharacterized protein YtfP